MFSALHYQGRRLYELAREGKIVERPARDTTVYAIAVLGTEFAGGIRAWLRIACSAGTYVRTLCVTISA